MGDRGREVMICFFCFVFFLKRGKVDENYEGMMCGSVLQDKDRSLDFSCSCCKVERCLIVVFLDHKGTSWLTTDRLRNRTQG